MTKVTYSHDIFSKQRYGGVSRYYVELIATLLEMGVDVRVCAGKYLNAYLGQEIVSSVVLGNAVTNRVAQWRWARFGLWLRNEVMERRCLQNSTDGVFHHTYYSPWRIRTKAPLVVTVHDLIHEKQGMDGSGFRRWTSIAKRNSIERADRVIAVSESTKRDMVQIYGVPEEKIRVIYHGGIPARLKTRETESHVSDRKGEDEKGILLFVGTRGGYKNFKSLLRAYARSNVLKNSFRLICFGGGRWAKDERLLLATLGVENCVELMMGGDAKLFNYYKKASLLVYPSLYEGFGIPVVEAMQLGCPVACGRGGSLPEVGGEAAAYFDASDVSSIQRVLEDVLFDERRRNAMRQSGFLHSDQFTWDATARATLGVYQELE